MLLSQSPTHPVGRPVVPIPSCPLPPPSFFSVHFFHPHIVRSIMHSYFRMNVQKDMQLQQICDEITKSLQTPMPPAAPPCMTPTMHGHDLGTRDTHLYEKESGIRLNAASTVQSARLFELVSYRAIEVDFGGTKKSRKGGGNTREEPNSTCSPLTIKSGPPATSNLTDPLAQALMSLRLLSDRLGVIEVTVGSLSGELQPETLVALRGGAIRQVGELQAQLGRIEADKDSVFSGNLVGSGRDQVKQQRKGIQRRVDAAMGDITRMAQMLR